MIILYSNATETNENVIACGIYAHGDLQNRLGYDVICPRFTELGGFDYKLTDIKEDGIYDVLIQHHNEQIPAKLYYWYIDKHDRHRGLAVLPEDQWANQNALDLYTQRSRNL